MKMSEAEDFAVKGEFVGMQQNCYICYANVPINQAFPMSMRSKYSRTLIHAIVKGFIDDELQARLSKEEIICSNCLLKLNQYDLASRTAKRLERSIRNALVLTEQTYRQDARTEYIEVEDFNA